jgi:hypothetical protein
MAQAATIQAASEVRFNRFMAGVYFVMSIGLAITAVVATWVAGNEDLLMRILTDSWFVFGLFMIQMVLVVILSGAVMRMSPAVAFILFLLYSAITGLTISSIFVYYSNSVIAYTFWVTAGMFLFTSVAGLFIKRDLSGIAMFLMIALMGWLFAWFFALLFPGLTGFNRSMNFIGILLFAGLTVVDTARLKQLSAQLEGKRGMGGLIILGALTLYLDFINLFLLMLRTSRR